MNTKRLDVVYPVRPLHDGENPTMSHDELRYSLRSLKNLPHRRVWIAGTVPSWVRGVGEIPLEPNPDKWSNINQSLRAAAAHPDVSDPFMYFNDDMYVVQRMTRFRTYHLGHYPRYMKQLESVANRNRSSYHQGLIATARQLVEWGNTKPYVYEGHVPLLWRKAEVRFMIDFHTHDPFILNAAYGASSGPVGVKGVNVKVHGADRRVLDWVLSHDQPYLSGDDASWDDGAVGQYVRGMFPEAGRYERCEVQDAALPQGQGGLAA